MGYDGKPNGSDFTIVTVVLQYSVFATHVYARVMMRVWLISNQGLLREEVIPTPETAHHE